MGRGPNKEERNLSPTKNAIRICPKSKGIYLHYLEALNRYLVQREQSEGEYDLKEIILYTDGGCRDNGAESNIGGIGIVLSILRKII